MQLRAASSRSSLHQGSGYLSKKAERQQACQLSQKPTFAVAISLPREAAPHRACLKLTCHAAQTAASRYAAVICRVQQHTELLQGLSLLWLLLEHQELAHPLTRRGLIRASSYSQLAMTASQETSCGKRSLCRPTTTKRLLTEVLSNETAWLSQQDPFQGMARSTVEALLQRKVVQRLAAEQEFSVGRDLVVVRSGSVSARDTAGELDSILQGT